MKPLKKKVSTDTLTTTFTSMRQRLLAMAERITGNRDEAADAVQDAFVRLWKHRDDIDRASSSIDDHMMQQLQSMGKALDADEN